jgi:hypothetical protein
LLQQFLDHLHRALVMINHQGQEQAIKIGALERGKFSHFLWAGHAGHFVGSVHGRVRRWFRHGLAAITQPSLHELNFIELRGVDAPGHVIQLRRIRAIRHQHGHLHRLVVVRNHVMHKFDVIRRIARVGNVDRFFGAKVTRCFARCAGLDNGHILGHAEDGITEKNNAR